MSSLLELQRRMAKAVMRPLTRTNQMRRVVRGRSMTTEAAEFILPNSRLTSFERLAIYNRQYWFRILDSLADDFPGVRAIVGEKQFNIYSRNYLAECPSESFTLRNLGSRFPWWLEQQLPRARARSTRACASQPARQLVLDMARLEWAHIEAFDAAEREPLGREQAAVLTADSRLALQPHVRLLELRHPADDILLAVKKSSPPVAKLNATERAKWFRQFPISNGPSGPHAEQPIYVATYRAEFSVHYKRVTREAFCLLKALDRGLPLAAAIEQAFVDTKTPEQDCAAKVQSWFAQWMTLGWFRRDEAIAAPPARVS